MKYFAILVTGLMLSSHVEAQVVQTTTEYDGSAQGNGTTIAVQPNLVSTQGTLSSSDWVSFEGNAVLNSLKDDSLEGGTEATSLTAGSDPWTLTISFDTSVNSAGYTITQLDAFTGWSADYVGQNYTVSYSTVAAPTTFISLTNSGTLGTSFTADSVEGHNSGTQVSLLTTLTPTVGDTFIATGVAALQYTFSLSPNDVAGGSGHVEAYREIQAFGTADPVPEPSTYAMMGLGLLGLIGLRRFRQLS